MPNSSSSDNNIGKDGVVKLCPLCKGAVRFIYINFNKKVLMCVNDFCEYPFGSEDLQFLKVNSGMPDIDVGSYSSSSSSDSSSSSMTSISSDIDKLNKVLELTKNRPLDLDVKPTTSKRTMIPDEHIANHKKIKDEENLKCFKMDLNETDQVTDESDLEVKLVKKEKTELFEQKISPCGGGELKIDIGSNKNFSSTNIQIMKTDGHRTSLEDVT